MAKLHTLKAGSALPDAILSIASSEKIDTAAISGIGGVRDLTLAYYNHETKKYEEHRFDEFLEVTSLVGNLTLKDGEPFLHIHGNFGRRDLSVVGGHVVRATVFPLLEVSVDETANTAIRELDENLGLSVIRSD